MSHSSHSCCHATHNADGGLLEVARLIQVLPVEVRERLKEPCTQTLPPPPFTALFEDQTFRGVQMSRVKAGGSFVAAELAVPSGLLLVLAGTECIIWPPVKNPSTEHSKSR